MMLDDQASITSDARSNSHKDRQNHTQGHQTDLSLAQRTQRTQRMALGSFLQSFCQPFNNILEMLFAEIDQVSDAQIS